MASYKGKGKLAAWPHVQYLQAMEVECMLKEIYKYKSSWFKWNILRYSSLDSKLEHWGRKLTMVNPKDNKNLEESVVTLVTSLSNQMRDQEYIPASTEVKFDVNVLGIGSYYSHTKKSPADEFNFLCESQMRTDHLRFVREHLQSTETTNFSRPDFFRIYDDQGLELKAADWRETFQQGLTKVLRSRYSDWNVVLNGPSLSFSSNVEKSPVKVDMTFGIPLDSSAPDHIWPLENTQVELGTNSGTQGTITPRPPRLGRIARCHFVPFGDLWRVSFAIYEVELIRQLSKEKRGFLVGLKVIFGT